jgi:hypothetical protein
MIADQETGKFYFTAKAPRRLFNHKGHEGTQRIYRKGRQGRKENLEKCCLGN